MQRAVKLTKQRPHLSNTDLASRLPRRPDLFTPLTESYSRVDPVDEAVRHRMFCPTRLVGSRTVTLATHAQHEDTVTNFVGPENDRGVYILRSGIHSSDKSVGAITERLTIASCGMYAPDIFRQEPAEELDKEKGKRKEKEPKHWKVGT